MTMFDDIATAIGNALGADKATGGYIAGALFSIVLMFILEWTLGGEREGKVFLVSVGIGFTLSGLFGWFPLWVPFLMGVVLAFILMSQVAGSSSSGV